MFVLTDTRPEFRKISDVACTRPDENAGGVLLDRMRDPADRPTDQEHAETGPRGSLRTTETSPRAKSTLGVGRSVRKSRGPRGARPRCGGDGVRP